jgi:hypothetical protein
MRTRTESEEGFVPEGKSDDSIAGGFLEDPGNYPGCVTWFAGRLVFAGTVNDRQRIWASRVIENGEINFATKTRFVTQSEEVLAVGGDAVPGEYKITGVKPETMGQLAAMGKDLKIKQGIFREGAKIEYLEEKQNAFVVNLPVPKTVGITEPELNQLREDKKAAEAALYGEHAVLLAIENSGNPNWKGTSTSYVLYYTAYRAYVRTEKITYKGGFKKGTSRGTIGITPSDDTDTLINSIVSGVGGRGQGIIRDYVKNHINRLKNDWQKLYFRGDEFPGKPDDAYSEILSEFPPVDDSFFVVYKETVLEDEYPLPDDGFTFEIASDMSDAIRWIGQNKNLLAGTETAEWVIPAGVNATGVQAVLNSRYGSDRIQGTSVGDAFCFFQTGRKALVEYYIPRQDNNFRASNMAMLSPDMLHESPAFDFDFISAPYTKIFVSREDGVVASLLYERSTGTFAWGRVITSGVIKSVATLPGESGYDEVYLVVERDAAGGGNAFFLERLDERGKVYLDSNEPWAGTAEQRAAYGDKAVVYDETADRIYPLDGEAIPPVPGDFSPPHVMYIGYPFTSRVRSMPVLANDRMKQNNIKALKVRFRDSFMPRVRSEPNKVENTIPHRGEPGESFTGVVNVPFPGVYERDVFFEFIFSEPRRCEILAVNAEVN